MKAYLCVLLWFYLPLSLLGQQGPYSDERTACRQFTSVSLQLPDGTITYGCRAYYVLLPVVADGESEMTVVSFSNMESGIIVMDNPFSTSWTWDMDAKDSQSSFVFGFLGADVLGPNAYQLDILGPACPTGQTCQMPLEVFNGVFTRVTAPDASTFDNVNVYAQLHLSSGGYLLAGTRTDKLTDDWTSTDACRAENQPYGVANMSLTNQAVEITARNVSGSVVSTVWTPTLNAGTKDALDPTEIYPGNNPQMGRLGELFPDLFSAESRAGFCGTFEFRSVGGGLIFVAVPQLDQPLRVHHMTRDPVPPRMGREDQ